MQTRLIAKWLLFLCCLDHPGYSPVHSHRSGDQVSRCRQHRLQCSGRLVDTRPAPYRAQAPGGDKTLLLHIALENRGEHHGETSAGKENKTARVHPAWSLERRGIRCSALAACAGLTRSSCPRGADRHCLQRMPDRLLLRCCWVTFPLRRPRPGMRIARRQSADG